MANTTGVQHTVTHSTAHVSQQRSETILIMKEIRNQVEDGLRNHVSQELQVGTVRRKQKSLSTEYLELCRYESSLGSESQNQRRGRITSDIGYDYDQGALVLL